MLEIVPETPALHADAIEDLFDRTFGPGHFAKTAERLREFSHSLPEITRVAVLDGRVIGVCRVWPLVVGPARDRALFYGPVAVTPEHRGSRLGLTVTGEALEAGAAAGWPAAILIGAPAYFGEIGFTVTPKNQLDFPGPQDQARVMVRDLAGDASRLAGLVTAP
ncbi:MAG TPA: N-acetyltransferase [Hyphomonas sp.]|nr:N-acetyltransferase [Hyphomonas sp.]MCC0017719.1 N-acetyltransferase [Rhodobiaceae bacterium]MCA8905436.1 N-acetyltransferase [Hyphomonas sp.]MCB9963043.1 N-acetyltransferase [Hyphomonas sp.]MCB9972434.1 N-acetyltransferase [Hyphomonas sp.]